VVCSVLSMCILTNRYCMSHVISLWLSHMVAFDKSVKLSCIISLRIGGIKYSFSDFRMGQKNFVHKYWKHGLFVSNALTNCFIIRSLMCKGGSRIFSRSTRLKYETFLYPVCNCSLSGHCTVSQCLSLALLPQSHRKRKFCVASLLSQQQSNVQITVYIKLPLRCYCVCGGSLL
jgi:hypothetical protein